MLHLQFDVLARIISELRDSVWACVRVGVCAGVRARACTLFRSLFLSCLNHFLGAMLHQSPLSIRLSMSRMLSVVVWLLFGVPMDTRINVQEIVSELMFWATKV